MRLGITGHRPRRVLDPDGVKTWLMEQVGAFHAEHGTQLLACTGMSIGTDLWFAQVCHELGVWYGAFVPWRGQASQWSTSEQAEYRRLLDQADWSYITHHGGYPGKHVYMDRNVDMAKWLLEGVLSGEGALLLAVYDGGRGGTGHMVDICTERDIEVVRFNPVERP